MCLLQVQQLALLGGSDVKKIIKNMMGELITTKLARACNWAGQRGPKKPFGVFKEIVHTVLSEHSTVYLIFFVFSSPYTCIAMLNNFYSHVRNAYFLGCICCFVL